MNMRQRRERVMLEVIFKNSAKHSDMLEIMDQLCNWKREWKSKANQTTDDVDDSFLFGGDQLTRERAYGSKLLRAVGAEEDGEKLKECIPKIEDWHAKMCFYQVSIIGVP